MKNRFKQVNTASVPAIYSAGVFSYILLDALKDILFFWVWWYSEGFCKAVSHLFLLFMYGLRILPIDILVKNLAKPMFGDYSYKGYIIGFFLRIFQLLFYVIFLIIWALVLIGLFLSWIFLPPIAVAFLLYSLGLTR